ncbi:peptidyl-prolyl cis-trans isomerase FKBP43-like isoform X2 [Prosopis cineraria]|uniref:peptidyl-prolyl cis-trans isomerase FKBP43-like isoform X2 n=1 Tax=Prosopis cineraria TaxID=364024 RepID=UPI00240EFC80|nr:peptidyl-prolyl cis-trans isomerase FKBP43-like isoform X2 [Prosopis cineraria]
MAFWGVEVKPGKSFTHKFDDFKGRLHVSMATLGVGSAPAKSRLQCNVGNSSPVYLCSLSSGTNESLQLHLEFEEVDDVIFSVIGPRSIHLCGYYLGNSRRTNVIEESESYGEDIANTETDRSNCSEEDEYEDSFIDDDANPDVYPGSPISREEEVSPVNKHKGSRRRLQRKQQRVDSDDDGVPISSLYKTKATAKVLSEEMDVSDDRRESDGSQKKGKDEDNNDIKPNSKSKAGNILLDTKTHSGAESLDNVVECHTNLNVRSIQKLEKEERETEEEGKFAEAKDACNGQFIEVNNVLEGEPKMDNIIQDLLIRNMSEGQACDKNVVLPATVVGPVKSRGTKRKKKEQAPKDSHFEDDNAYCKESKAPRDSAGTDIAIPKFSEGKNQDLQQNNKENGDNGTHDFPDANQSGDRKMKKRRKKDKSQGDVEVNTSDMPQSSANENIRTLKKDEYIVADAKSSAVKTLPNGLVIQELEKGIEDGKIAASGNKLTVLFTGKVKDNDEVFESNVGHAPFKFRLGKGQVLEGWDVGLEGMRIGGKRRLIIPPSMGFGSEGHDDKVPPNSWLVYDFELVKVR